MPLEGSEGGPPQMLSANHINRPRKDPDKKSLASIRVIRGQLFFFSYPCHPRTPRMPAYSRARVTLNEGNSVTFTGPVEFMLGYVGRDAGTLMFKGKFETPDSISGEVEFAPLVGDRPSKHGAFKAVRARE